MAKAILIPIGAGLVAATAFLSVALGQSGLAAILYLVIPLPILLVGLGQGWTAAFVAAVSATLLIFGLGNAPAALVFAIAHAMPPVLLSYLALQSRPGGPDSIEWYPVGRLVLVTAAIGAIASLGAVLALGGTMDAIKQQIGPPIEALIKQQTEAGTAPASVSPADAPRITEVAAALLPAGMAVGVMMGHLLNLWLAGRIAHASGQLARTWPDLSELRFPRGTALVFAGASGLSFAGGIVGFAGGALAAALLVAYALAGLAIAHNVTRGAAWRPFALWTLYFAMLFFNPVLLLLALAGLIDTVTPLRRGPVPTNT